MTDDKKEIKNVIKSSLKKDFESLGIKDFSGKVLKRDKVLISKAFKGLAEKGTKWEEIPQILRENLEFSEKDFN